MAQARLIHKVISVSEPVADLPVHSQLVFTWSIPHADDIGILPCSIKKLKSLIVPMWDGVSFEQFAEYVESIVRAGLWVRVVHDGADFYMIPNFLEHQSLRRDRQPQTILRVPLCTNVKESWKALDVIVASLENSLLPHDTSLETNDNRMETNDGHLAAELNGSEVNRTEVNRTEIGDFQKNRGRSEIVKETLKKMKAATVTDSTVLADVMDGFKAVNPSAYNLFKNNTQRTALDRMCQEHGVQAIREVIAILPETNAKKFAPTITTPVQLENDMGKLSAFLQKSKDSGKGRQIIS